MVLMASHTATLLTIKQPKPGICPVCGKTSLKKIFVGTEMIKMCDECGYRKGARQIGATPGGC